MSDLVVHHGAAATLLDRQARLGAIERLDDLPLFVDRLHEGMWWRIDMEGDDVVRLGGELRVVRQLEMARPMRLQAMFAPDALPPLTAAVPSDVASRTLARPPGCNSGDSIARLW